MIDRYLEDVDSYLHLDRAHRERVLAEIEGHLHDSVAGQMTDGVQPQDAVRRAIAQIGPPRDVAMQFSPPPPPARAVRGRRRWAPVILPAAAFAAGAALTAWNVVHTWQHGLSRGAQLALRYSLLYTAVFGALAAATWVAITIGDRDPAWRRAAWSFAALTGVITAMSYLR